MWFKSTRRQADRTLVAIDKMTYDVASAARAHRRAAEAAELATLVAMAAMGLALLAVALFTTD